ncbi:mCG145182, partial [Mus musculus]
LVPTALSRYGGSEPLPSLSMQTDPERILYSLGSKGAVALEEACLSLFLLPADLDVEFSVPSPAPCLPVMIMN